MPPRSFPRISSRAEARALLEVPWETLHQYAGEVRHACSGMELDLCSIINVKSGGCTEDCAFCAQSSKHQTEAPVYPLVDKNRVEAACSSSRAVGAGRFCVVTSGRGIRERELGRLSDMVTAVSATGLLPCATLGLSSADDLIRLKDAGLHRYHHNLEASERFFGKVCTTHSYRDRIETVVKAKSTGLSVCSGGIFGMGETWQDRIDLAFALRDLDVDSVPINFLVPVPGTRMAARPLLNRNEALRIVALFRLVLPEKEIRICGGRNAVFQHAPEALFSAGANGFLIGNYLTTLGRDPADDLAMVQEGGYQIRRHGP